MPDWLPLWWRAVERFHSVDQSVNAGNSVGWLGAAEALFGPAQPAALAVGGGAALITVACLVLLWLRRSHTDPSLRMAVTVVGVLLLQPHAMYENKNVARFVERNGNGIYMASIESDDIPAIQERVTATGDGWQGTDFGGFIHPKRLHGLLLGLVSFDHWNSQRPLPD